MKQLLFAICSIASLLMPAAAQDVISLEGAWDFATGPTAPTSYSDYVMLPGSMLTNGKGDDVSVRTLSLIHI